MTSKRMRDAEEMRRRKQTRSRFRNMVRMVALNRTWLSDQGDQKMSLNFKKNISMLVRPQAKIGSLTMNEKGILRTHPSMRTVEERKRLVLLLAGLSCFSKIPPKVCSRLAPVISFMYADGGRVIIREGDVPVFVYFLLSGDVAVSKKVFDHLSNSYVDKMEGLCGPGDCIGDIEVIENCERRNTYTAASTVELLLVLESDFQRILYPVMARQWLDKKNAILALGYFKFFNEEQLINACKVSQIRQFEPLETIYYEDKGPVSYVHFVISGECIILQCLKMRVSQKKGNKCFELVKISKDDGDDLFKDMTNQDLLKKLRSDDTQRKSVVLNVVDDVASDDEDDESRNERRHTAAIREMEIKKVEISCGLRKPSDEELVTEEIVENPAEIEIHENAEHDNETASHEMKNDTEDNAVVIDDNEVEIVTGVGPSLDIEQKEIHEEEQQQETDDTKPVETALEKEEEPTLPDNPAPRQTHVELNAPPNEDTNIGPTTERTSGLRPSHESLSDRKSTMSVDSQRYSRYSTPSVRGSTRKSIKVENRFIDVGSLTFGGIFGLGEKIEHRVVMARTTVQCLMLPRFWLFEKDQNPGNIWQRRRFYLDTTIPSRQSLFTDFLTTRKWQQFKNDLIDECVDQSLLSNPTKVQDVPIICRIVEANDD